ncbi:jg27860 [Pararge aegeria aegeria]|uniref:Jg27860 protein n=1 Tax=Pararge aegeria aegeria TaxID=348720 RepID=A0A8S4QWJ3_9NEOP|nr:jg27860 [Pararge aegeria aegeria]
MVCIEEEPWYLSLCEELDAFCKQVDDKVDKEQQQLKACEKRNELESKLQQESCGALECPSNRRSGLQSEEPPYNTRRFKDYCRLNPTLDPTTKRKLLKMLVEAFREKTID